MTFNLFRLSTVCSCFNWFSSGSLDFGRVFLQLVSFTRWVCREIGPLDWFSQCPSMFQTLSIPFHWSRTDSAYSEPRFPVVVFRDISKESCELLQQLVSHFRSLGATSEAFKPLQQLLSHSSSLWATSEACELLQQLVRHFSSLWATSPAYEPLQQLLPLFTTKMTVCANKIRFCFLITSLKNEKI